MFLWSLSAQQTTYRIGNHVYYWVWLRPDRLMWRKQNNNNVQPIRLSWLNFTYSRTPALRYGNRRVKETISSRLCVCVLCVVIPLTLLDVRLLDAPAGVTQEEDHTGFLHFSSAVLVLIFLARRIQLPLSWSILLLYMWWPYIHIYILSSTVKSNFVYPRINRSPLVGHDFCILHFYFYGVKSQFVWLHRDSNSRPNVRRFRGYQLNL